MSSPSESIHIYVRISCLPVRLSTPKFSTFPFPEYIFVCAERASRAPSRGYEVARGLGVRKRVRHLTRERESVFLENGCCSKNITLLLRAHPFVYIFNYPKHLATHITERETVKLKNLSPQLKATQLYKIASQIYSIVSIEAEDKKLYISTNFDVVLSCLGPLKFSIIGAGETIFFYFFI